MKKNKLISDNDILLENKVAMIELKPTEIFFPDWYPENKKKNNNQHNLSENQPINNKLISTQFIEILTDKNNIKFKTAKTNNCFSGEYPLKTDICCGWCRYKFDTQPIGIPIKKHKNNYWMDGCFCSFECCLAFINDHHEKIYEKQDPLYSRSELLLFELFEILAHGSILKPANDWRLLEKVSTGKMTISQFRSNFFTFIRTPNVKFHSSNVYYQLI